jgi:hypothetical protein
MKLAIMQPYFFPYLGYYQTISAVDKYMLYDNLAYIKEGWVNKNRLLVVNGEPVYFLVHVKNKSSFKKIREIELVDNRHWREKMLKSIFMNYKRRPFFNEVYPLVEGVINEEVRLLTDLNAKSIFDVAKFLEIKTEITTDTSKYADLEEKLANDVMELSARFPTIRLRNPQVKVIRVLEICRAEGAETFINAWGGQALYDKEEFAQNNIELFFIRTDAYSYPQSTKVFHPHLSIVDVLMNCGKEGTQELLGQYTLVSSPEMVGTPKLEANVGRVIINHDSHG